MSDTISKPPRRPWAVVLAVVVLILALLAGFGIAHALTPGGPALKPAAVHSKSVDTCEAAFVKQQSVAEGYRKVLADENKALLDYVNGDITASEFADTLSTLTDQRDAYDMESAAIKGCGEEGI